MTPHWDTLLDEASLAALLPSEHSRFARPIRDALSLFLGGLPESRQTSMLLAQAKLPVQASFSQRLAVLERWYPAAVEALGVGFWEKMLANSELLGSDGRITLGWCSAETHQRCGPGRVRR